ncbi:hypothetical protein H0H93_011611 [Arthromyces matolae]|nr:hypothetical protein H0H93_011611 [Arthromyces matolae]
MATRDSDASNSIGAHSDYLSENLTTRKGSLEKTRETRLLLLEKETLESRLENLRDRYNSLSATGCLPFEILSQIFHLAITPTSTLRRRYQTLFAICRVCSTWRSVALGSPNLWSYIFFDGIRFDAKWVDKAIPRAQNTDLSVLATIGTFPSLHQFKNLLTRFISRIVDLEVRASFLFLRRVCHESLGENTILNRLTLVDTIVMLGSEPITISHSFSPHLHTLVLRGCMISEESPLLLHASLTTLIIEGELGRPLSLMDVLRFLPKLRTLDLRRPQTITNALWFPDDPAITPVHLPELHSFTLHADNLSAKAILSPLKIPLDASIQLHIYLNYVTHFSSFAHEFHRIVADSQGISHLSLELSSKNMITMRVWQSDHLGDSLPPAPPRATLTFGAGISTTTNFFEFQLFLGHFIFNDLEYLHVHDVELTRDNWRSMFGSLPSLKTIRVQETRHALQHELRLALGDINVRGQKSRLEMYKQYPPPIPPKDPARFLFRSLETLIGVNWSLQSPGPLWSFPLVNSLRERKAAGLVLRSLHLICRREINQDDVELLDMLVEHFSWAKMTSNKRNVHRSL